MPDSKPSSVDLFYKLRTAPIHALKRGLRLDDPEQDSDHFTAGIQNEGEFEIPFNKENEKYDVFYRAYNEHGEAETVGIKRELFRVNLNQVGGLNTSTLVFVISDPGADDAFAADDVIQIEDELLVVDSYIAGTNTITVEERGAHGTRPASHANDVSIILCRYTVPHKSIVMSGDERELSAPQISLIPILGGYIITAIAPADPDSILDSYIIFRSDSSPAQVQRDVVKVRAGESTHIFYHFLTLNEDRTIPWFIRIKSVTRSAVKGSAFSNEVSGKVLLPDEEAEAGEPNAPNMEVLADGGGVGEQDFRFLFGVELRDNTNIAGISQTQVQVAGPNAAHDPMAGFSAALIDKIFARKPPFSSFLTVTEPSDEIGGAYQFSSRLFNKHADIWSDWSNPIAAFTQAGVKDIGVPNEPRAFALHDILDAGDTSGNRFTFTIKEPSLNSRTIWQYEIQGSNDIFAQRGTAGIEDNTGLSGIQSIGTGRVTVGEIVLTVATGGAGNFAADAFRNKVLYIHGGMPTESGTNNFTGELLYPQAFVIGANTVSAGGNITTVTLRSSESGFKLPAGASTQTVNWIIADDWQESDTLLVRTFRVWSLVASGTPDSERFQGEISSEPTRYWRVRAWNRPGAGRWIYSDALTGTTQVSEALSFRTSKPVVGDFSVSKGFQAQVTSDVRFSAMDNNSISWTSGTIYYPDGDDEAVNSGSMNLASGRTYWVYKSVGAGNRTLGITLNPAFVLSTTRVLVAQISTSGDTAELATIVTPWMLGSTFTAAAINVNRLSAITANIGAVTLGSLTGVIITASVFRTASSGRRVEISAGAPFINFHRSSGGGAVYASIASEDADGGTLDIQPAAGSSGHFQVGLASKRWEEVSLNAQAINLDALGGDVHVDGTIIMNLPGTPDFTIPAGTVIAKDYFAVLNSITNASGIAITVNGIASVKSGSMDYGALDFNTGGLSRGFIHPNGGWFIGLAGFPVSVSPLSTVEGNLTVKRELFKEDSLYNNPDFVLEHWAHGSSKQKPSYSGLMSLPKLESFLRREIHLPAVDNSRPSGIFERGDWVLESMESAYLYILQLHKRIAKLEAGALS